VSAALALSTTLLAAPSAMAVTVDTVAQPVQGDVAVIDCSQKANYLNYGDKSTGPYNRFKREVFHVKDWDGGQPVVAYVVPDSGEIVTNSYSPALVTNEGANLSLTILDAPLGELNLEIPATPRGTATLSGTEKMRHGEGEIQITGTCESQIIRLPATKKSAS
jgi:hypothetical protein